MTYRVGLQAAEEETERRSERAVNTFVVRRRPTDGAAARYEIAHVQSGRCTVAADDAVAAAWIGGFGLGGTYSPDRAIVARSEVS